MKQYTWTELPAAKYSPKWEVRCNYCQYAIFVYDKREHHERERCYWCRRDHDGNISWDIHQEYDYGYFGDGDGVPMGRWKGAKIIEPCMAPVTTSSWGSSYHPSVPQIYLQVSIYSNILSQNRRRRPETWRASLCINTYCSVDLFDVPQKCKSIKQVKAIVDGLDLTAKKQELLKRYYNRNNVRCVWRDVDGALEPYYSCFDSIDGLREWAAGNYAIYEPTGHMASYQRSDAGLCGTRFDKSREAPTPWVTSEWFERIKWNEPR